MPSFFWDSKKKSTSSSSQQRSYDPHKPPTPPTPPRSENAPSALTVGSVRSDSIEVTSVRSTTSSRDDYRQELSDVVVVGAGPAGLLLADNLVRFGIKTHIIDNRAERTQTGRADGVQPKTIETLRQMRLAEPLLRKGVRIYDIAFWKSTSTQKLHRTARETYYPPLVDLLDPYMLLVHQGMVESVFVNDLKERGVEVQRNTAFVDYKYTPKKVRPLQILAQSNVDQVPKTLGTRYLVGCDGAHSQVRKCLPDSRPVGVSRDAVWGVLDGVVDTEFPDIWSKVVISSEEHGSVLILPRERNITRLYIEMKPDSNETTIREEITQEFVMKRAKEIMAPYPITWRSIEWFGRYKIGQRVATQFTDEDHKVFIAGDASHTHSPKAAQGMNTSMHDSWNLAWKLNFAIRDLAKSSLLETYELERKKIAEDLINFDYEHNDALSAGPEALAANFAKNIAFISGYGVEYNYNILNVPSKSPDDLGNLKPGHLLPPAKVTRFIDVNPVDIQTDIPALGQFRIYFFTHDIHASKPFLDYTCTMQQSMSSFVGRLTSAGNASYAVQPPLAAPHDEFVCPERYTPVSGLFTYALVTSMDRSNVEISDLPGLLRDSRWTFYLDDCPERDTRKRGVMDKWFGGLGMNEVVVLVVRPDGYLGAGRRWGEGGRREGVESVRWLDEYFGGFMKDQ
ncbi:FAD monooxygenase-like protein [Delitschia confertaspora ATCC 74209]|uniref:FAD monooxygenase-like protein n=1 Tax=Delitschia confertaspora ATCC 74209 TaxID=1513339 RepID=A0A9P4MUD4_9PLEO|nr:FAD monooxygenase-like protein [Delitschia confertaspora ATCC 74209]